MTEREAFLPRPGSITVVLLWSNVLWVPFGCHSAGTNAGGHGRFSATTPVRSGIVHVAPFVYEKLAGRDPLAFVRSCTEHYRDNIRDYRCRFEMRERRGRALRREETFAVRFRQEPFSVDLRSLSSGGRAKRVNYVAGRWTHGGREWALVQPAGILGWLLPGGVRRDIRGSDMAGASKYPIDQFGFLHTLERLLSDCGPQADVEGCDLRYVGRGAFDARPTYVFERRLPGTTADRGDPNRLFIMHIDAAWLVPTACYTYATDEKTTLLGRYLTTAVEFNVGLTDEDFR